MKRFLASLALGVGLSSFLMVTGVSAQAPTPPEIAARNFVLLDLTTNQTLAERDADTPQDPASLTKLMTAYIVFDALKAKRLTLEQTLTVSKRAWDERKGDPDGKCSRFAAEAKWMKPDDKLTVVLTVEYDGKPKRTTFSDFVPKDAAHKHDHK